MRLARVVASLVVVSVVAGPAHAQAPGETPPQPPSSVPAGPNAGPNPAPPEPSCRDCYDPMRERFSVGLSLAATGLNSAEQEQLDFGGGALAIRYRVLPQLEVLAEFAGGRENEDHGQSNGGRFQSFALGARYRFAVHRPFNGYLAALFGGTSLITDSQRNDGGRPTFEIGGGIEYRFGRHIALAAELRLMALAALGERSTEIPYSTNFSGGQLGLGVNVYF